MNIYIYVYKSKNHLFGVRPWNILGITPNTQPKNPFGFRNDVYKYTNI